MTVRSIRADIATVLPSLGGIDRHMHWEFPCGPGRGHLRVIVTVRGSVTTDIEVDRWNTLDSPDDGRAWLGAHIWPFAHRWSARTRRWNTLPTPGSCSYTTVLSSEAAQALRLWIPQELAWAALGDLQEVAR